MEEFVVCKGPCNKTWQKFGRSSFLRHISQAKKCRAKYNDDDLKDILAHVQAEWEAVKECGARAAFASLPEEVQRTYVEVSLKELSAYVCWKQHWGFIDEAAWHALHCDDKAWWVPEDHRAVLMADAIWEPLLVDGPPACDVASTLPADNRQASGVRSRILTYPNG